MSRGGRGTGGGSSRGGGGYSSSRGGGARPSSSSSFNRGNRRQTLGSNFSTGNYSNSNGDLLRDIANIVDIAEDVADIVKDVQTIKRRSSDGKRTSFSVSKVTTRQRTSNPGYNSSGKSTTSYSYSTDTHKGDINILWTLIGIIVIAITIGGLLFRDDGYKVKNFVPRVKLESDNEFMTDCVIDNSELFNDETAMESNLKYFYKKTGVQPIVISNLYNSNVNSNNDAFNWAVDYYDSNITREDALILVYFDAKNIDDEGYSAVVTGHMADSVMDAGAIEIFWNYFDRYWYDTKYDFDDIFVNTYKDTADSIMSVSKTGKDIAFMIIGLVIISVVGGTIIVVVYNKRKQAKEKAESDERILNSDLSKSSTGDSVLNKYM